jgi:hypothetical protein
LNGQNSRLERPEQRNGAAERQAPTPRGARCLTTASTLTSTSSIRPFHPSDFTLLIDTLGEQRVGAGMTAFARSIGNS